MLLTRIELKASAAVIGGNGNFERHAKAAGLTLEKLQSKLSEGTMLRRPDYYDRSSQRASLPSSRSSQRDDRDSRQPEWGLHHRLTRG
jgi:hypothetical protein